MTASGLGGRQCKSTARTVGLHLREIAPESFESHPTASGVCGVFRGDAKSLTKADRRQRRSRECHGGDAEDGRWRGPSVRL